MECHIHIFDNQGNLLGRVVVATGEPLDAWPPPKKGLSFIKELQKEKRL